MTTPRFTVKRQRWVPRLTPLDLEDATPEQLKAMEVTPSSGKISEYVRTLAHDPESYAARTILFNAIMYVEDGLPRAERELGALAASLYNGCVYCASIHARRYDQLAGPDGVVETLYRSGLNAKFESPRVAAIVDFAQALSQTPPQLTAEHVARLRAVGMDDAEIHDLTHAVAIFGFANRLMHTLGDSVPA